MAGMTIQEYERITPVTTVDVGGSRINYVTPNSRTVWRAQTLFKKEPSTIEWLDSMEAGDVLFDVGANVGMYSIYAAVKQGGGVHAFEPEADNFSILCRNALVNKVSDWVTCWPLALSNARRYDRLYIREPGAGNSCNSFGAEVDFNLAPSRFPVSQGCVSATLDDMVEARAIDRPNHIKIDVDGFEHLVLEGARKLLGDPGLRSFCIEINPSIEAHRIVVRDLLEAGFAIDAEQVARATRAEGPFKGVAEHVFRR